VGRNVSKILPLVTDIYANIKTNFLEKEAWFYRSGIEVYFFKSKKETSAFFCLTRPLSCETNSVQ
jgi:hypothetical protein